MDSNAHFQNLPKIELTYQIKHPQFAGLQPLQGRKVYRDAIVLKNFYTWLISNPRMKKEKWE